MLKIKKKIAFTGLEGNDGESRQEYRSSLQEFDKNNNMIKDVNYHPGGEIDSASGFKYDEENRLKEEIHFFEDEQVGEIINYKYNSDGKPVEIETTYADESKSVKKLTRVENVVSVKAYDEDGELENEEMVKLNDKGSIIEEITFDEDREIMQRTLYNYNGSDRVISKTKFGENDEFIIKAVYEYNDEGNTTSEIQLNHKNKLVNRINYDYDDKGNQVGWQNNNYTQKTEYDPAGNVISEETRNRFNNTVENFTEYRYNNKGLVIEERTFSIGQQYELQPGVFGRTGSDLLVTRYEYEFYED